MDNKSNMKKIGLMMSLYMSLVMSVFMTITGVCTGMLPNVIKGNVPPQALIGSIISGFIISFVISMLIGIIIPMHKVTRGATKNMKPGLGKKCIETLLSDLIYTPLISIVMVAFAYIQNQQKGISGPPYIVMLIPSLIACFIVGYILIFIFQPMFMRSLMKKYRPGAGPEGGPHIVKPENRE